MGGWSTSIYIDVPLEDWKTVNEMGNNIQLLPLLFAMFSYMKTISAVSKKKNDFS